ncbi:hypothetical protein C5167_013160 [Papaver somniferum]|uniref:Uncharacterized protein n=1 Tax=Papaver somniferum TaxID=3469 RepID=A0A4Y7J3H5_PAPSO|nr:uncharacterized protein LOC113361305 [Papaver somniferum]RZC54308.1 hypothetical protein C5167_013160 [Papaver somniferum]
MASSSKQQWASNFTTIRMVVALILCLLFLGDISYSGEAAAKWITDGAVSSREIINYECTSEGICVDDEDCNILCRAKKYSGGICDPSDPSGDDWPLGICCCLS